MKASHQGFKVREHNPIRFWIGIGLVLLLLVVMFLFGRAYQGYELKRLNTIVETLELRIEELELRNQGLVEKNAQLASSNRIEHDAYEQLNQTLVEKERDILGLKEQLVFYQGIVSPEQLALGVNIQSFELEQKNNLGLYAYKLVLTKRGKSNQYIKGKLNLNVKGEKNGADSTLQLKEIKQDFVEKDGKFSFRYFQVFEGDIMIPEGFEPYDVELDIRPSTKKIKNFKESITWSKALLGGVE